MTRLIGTMLLLACVSATWAAGPPDAATWERFGKIEEVWSVGDAAFGHLWHVNGSNGENRVSASAPGQAEAWWRACVQARELGIPVDDADRFRLRFGPYATTTRPGGE